MDPNQNNQPQYQSPTPQPSMPTPPLPGPQPAYQAPVTANQENPGQTLGIVSIVMIFVMPLLGIVFGAMSRSKSKAAGMPSGLGTAGLIINIIVLVIGTIISVLFFFLVILAASSDTSSSSSLGSTSFESPSSDLEDTAKQVARYAEAYNAEAGDYPKYTSDFAKYPSSTMPDEVKNKVYGSMLMTNTSLTYIYCGAGSAQIVYLGDTKEDKRTTPLGSASSTEVCARQY